MPVNRPPVLEVRSLTKFFPAGGGWLPGSRKPKLHAVDDVSFNLYPGRITALVGESGSGKSTIARLITTIYPSTEAYPLRGSGHHQATRAQRETEVPLGRPDDLAGPFASLNPVKRIEYDIRRPLRIHNIVPRSQVRQRVRSLLETVACAS